MISDLNPNLNSDLSSRLLPPALIVKDYVQNEHKCNYELYMLELVNSSRFFTELSNAVSARRF